MKILKWNVKSMVSTLLFLSFFFLPYHQPFFDYHLLLLLLLLVNEEGNIHCAFLFGKSLVTPLGAIKIPCLELSAATMSVRHDRMLKRETEIPLSTTSMFWSDSVSVLRYSKNEPKRFHTTNRISMIHDGSTPNQWRYIEGTVNPGNSVSRPMTA